MLWRDRATALERLRQVDELTSGFVYAVSTAAITGGKLTIDETRRAYFRRLKEAGLRHPILIGFGISDRESFKTACEQVAGAIIGSAFIRRISDAPELPQAIEAFVREIRGNGE